MFLGRIGKVRLANLESTLRRAFVGVIGGVDDEVRHFLPDSWVSGERLLTFLNLVAFYMRLPSASRTSMLRDGDARAGQRLVLGKQARVGPDRSRAW